MFRFRSLSLLLAMTAGLLACPRRDTTTTTTPAEPDNDVAEAPVDPALAHLAARLPADWEGSGVLEERPAAPSEAPEWAKVAAEVVDEDGHRFLRTSGLTQNIRNPALARQAAAARARARLAEWLGTEQLVGVVVTDHWAAAGTSAARAQLEVAASWQPGRVHEAPEPLAQP